MVQEGGLADIDASISAKKPSAITFHVSKKHWFNEEKQGIHIESFLSLDPKKRRKTNLTVHLLHTDLIPGTTMKRREISQPVVDAIFDEISGWEGYRFRTGKYGMQPFSLELDGTSPDFDQELTAEASRLCRKLGPLIDKVLKDLIAGPRNHKRR